MSGTNGQRTLAVGNGSAAAPLVSSHRVNEQHLLLFLRCGRMTALAEFRLSTPSTASTYIGATPAHRHLREAVSAGPNPLSGRSVNLDGQLGGHQPAVFPVPCALARSRALVVSGLLESPVTPVMRL